MDSAPVPNILWVDISHKPTPTNQHEAICSPRKGLASSVEEDKSRPKSQQMAAFEPQRAAITTKKTVFRVIIP